MACPERHDSSVTGAVRSVQVTRKGKGRVKQLHLVFFMERLVPGLIDQQRIVGIESSATLGQ